MTDELETPHIVWATWGEDEEYPLDIAFELEDSAEHRKESQVEDLEVVPLVRADQLLRELEKMLLVPLEDGETMTDRVQKLLSELEDVKVKS